MLIHEFILSEKNKMQRNPTYVKIQHASPPAKAANRIYTVYVSKGRGDLKTTTPLGEWWPWGRRGRLNGAVGDYSFQKGHTSVSSSPHAPPWRNGFPSLEPGWTLYLSPSTECRAVVLRDSQCWVIINNMTSSWFSHFNLSLSPSFSLLFFGLNHHVVRKPRPQREATWRYFNQQSWQRAQSTTRHVSEWASKRFCFKPLNLPTGAPDILSRD